MDLYIQVLKQVQDKSVKLTEQAIEAQNNISINILENVKKAQNWFSDLLKKQDD